MSFVLVWSEGDDKRFEIFAERKPAEEAAMDHRGHGRDAYVVHGELTHDPATSPPASPAADYLLGAFKG